MLKIGRLAKPQLNPDLALGSGNFLQKTELTANQALTYFASGQIPQNSNSYLALNEKKTEMITIRNQTVIGLLLLVILGLLVF